MGLSFASQTWVVQQHGPADHPDKDLVQLRRCTNRISWRFRPILQALMRQARVALPMLTTSFCSGQGSFSLCSLPSLSLVETTCEFYELQTPGVLLLCSGYSALMSSCCWSLLWHMCCTGSSSLDLPLSAAVEALPCQRCALLACKMDRAQLFHGTSVLKVACSCNCPTGRTVMACVAACLI